MRVIGDADLTAPDDRVDRSGDYVSLLPLSERVDGVTTHGLRYPLSDATLTQGPARGLSNELLGTRLRRDHPQLAGWP